MPSGWLKFVVPDEDASSPLKVALAPDSTHPIEIPVPLRQYPLLPNLLDQTAGTIPPSLRRAMFAEPIEKLIEEHLKWDYTIHLKKPEKVAQDDLWVTATFNRPLDWQPDPADDLGPLTPLTKSLLRFRAAFESLTLLLPALNGSDQKAQKLAALLVTIIGDVVSNLRPKRMFAEPPQVERIIWVLDYAHAYDERKELLVFGKVQGSKTQLVFPSISEHPPATQPVDVPPTEAPDGQAGWKSVTYVFSGGVPDDLVIAVGGLNLLSQQTVIGSTRIVRNANLGTDVDQRAVNRLLVYETPELSFGNVLVPFVDVTDSLGPVNGGALPEVINQLLLPLTAAGAAVGKDRVVRLAATFNYPVVDGATGALMAKLPALLNAGQALGDDPQPLASTFADGLVQWYGDLKLPTNGAYFSLAISLFINLASSGGGRQLPLLTFEEIKVSLPAGWPGGSLH